jgi:hypothetical protein
MFHPIELDAQLAQEQIERNIAAAALRRQARREPARSVRHAIGRLFIQIGARIAAEPPRESVRSRWGPDLPVPKSHPHDGL